MSALIPFESAKLPAHIKAKGSVIANWFAAAAGSGFPTISIKGKVFHIVRGGDKELVTKPGADDEPASNLEAVVVSVNPQRSKVYYAKGYTEGSDEKPECYSNNGLTPELDAATPQAAKCAACKHNVFGSKITDDGRKAKACADSMRLAVAAAGQLNDPMLLRVPAASLKALGQYGELLAKRGVEPHQVVTKIGFDYTVAHPQLTFKPVGFVTDEMLVEIEKTRGEPVTKQITGEMAVPRAEADEFQQEAPAPKAVAKAKPAPVVEEDEASAPAPKAAKAKPAPVTDDDDLPAAPRAKVKVEAAEVVATEVASLDDLDFDD